MGAVGTERVEFEDSDWASSCKRRLDSHLFSNHQTGTPYENEPTRSNA